MPNHSFLLGAILSVASLGSSFGYDFTKYVAAGDPYPGGGTVDFMTFPVLSNGSVVVSSASEIGEAQFIGGPVANTPQLLIGRNTPIPGGTGNFEVFSRPAYWNGTLAFTGTGSGGQVGVYAGTPGSLIKIADKNTLIPSGGGATFVEINPQSPQIGINAAGDIAFTGAAGSQDGALTGVYRYSGGTLTRIVDTTQFVPGSTTPFQNLSNPTLTATSTAFFGTASTGQTAIGGLYESSFTDGTLTPIAIAGQQDPDGKTFTSFSGPLAGGNRIAFVAEQTEGLGLYYKEAGILHTVFTTGMAIPGTETLAAEIVASFSVNENGDIVFQLLDENANPYIVAWVGGQFTLVADLNTNFGGKTPVDNPQALGIANYQFSGNQIAVYAVTGPGEFATYVTTIPEPGTIALLTLGGAVAVLGLRKRLGRR